MDRLPLSRPDGPDRGRELLKLLVEHTPAAVALFDRDMRYIVASRRFLADYRLRWDDIAGRSHYEVFPEIPQRWRDIHARCLAGAVEFCDADPFPREDGRVDWVRWEIQPWRDTEGGIGGIILFSEVLTSELEALEAARTSEERFAAIFEQAAVGLALATADGRYLRVNSRLCGMLGYDAETLGGMRFQDITHPDDLGEDLANLQRLQRGEIPHFAMEKRYIHRDGSTVWVNLTVSLLSERDESGCIAVIEDITDRKRIEEERALLEEQMQQARKMDAVGRLAGGVAHDYNNMLSVIIGYTEMALSRVPPGDPLHGDLLEVVRAARQSADITGQLLAFARKQTINPRTLDLNETVETMLNMLRRLIGEDISLGWSPAADLWPVKLDPVQVDQILANLCVNARDAIDTVGTVTIETGNASFDDAYCRDHPGFRPGHYVCLAVSDDGCGMDQATVSQVFEPFFTTKGDREGTGLGLATIYGIVRQNEGFINVYSEPGHGTTFRIYLPRSAGDTSPIVGAGAAVPRGRGETILVVEDEASILELIRRMLTELGYRTLVADSPAAAIAMVAGRTGDIDLLFTDVIMPGMTGRDLSRRLSAEVPGLVTLYMSGYTADVIAHRGVLDNGISFLSKPFTQKTLAQAIRLALGARDVD